MNTSPYKLYSSPSSRMAITLITIAAALLLSACSNEGSVTTLEEQEAMPLEFPVFLLDSGEISADDLRPLVTLSNGDTVSVNRGAGLTWSGTVNLEADDTYELTVTWLENIDGRDLPLARLTQDLTINRDGSIEQSPATAYDTDFDEDGDGVSNLVERGQVSDPFGTGPVTPVVTPTEPDTQTAVFELEFPEFVLENNIISTNDMQPRVALSNGDMLSVNKVNATTWRATLDFAPNTSYSITITWIELYLGEILPLTSMTEDLNLRDDGSVEQVNRTGFQIAFDFDNDGRVNLFERFNGTDPIADGSVGFSIAERDSNSRFNSSNDALLRANSAVPTMADVIVPRISENDAPAIDGKALLESFAGTLGGEWANAVQNDISGATLSIDNLISGIDAADTGLMSHHRWAAIHDGRYLYILVVDDDGQHQPNSDSTSTNDNSLELFLNLANNKLSTDDKNLIHQIIPARHSPANATTIIASGDEPATSDVIHTPLNIDVATGTQMLPARVGQANHRQDVYELRIDMATTGISTDAPIGFELQVNDHGLHHDLKWGWKRPARQENDIDYTLSSPSLMGTLVLE